MMFGLTALELARIQFGFTVSFHIIFPAITIGLASYLAVLEGLWLWKKDAVYRDLYHFWSKIFAVNFAMGVVSGLVMAYQFGTNWSYFSAFAGSITGPLLTYEVLTAFFLEAGFLGVMLFGWNKVGPGLHFFATIMVATRHADFGHLDSRLQQLDADAAGLRNHQRPRRAGRLAEGDLQSVVPLPPRAHGRGGLSGDRAVRRRVGRLASLEAARHAAARTMLSMAMWMVLVVAPIQIAVGDQHGLNTLKHQPAKIAAIEGHWENRPGESVPLILFGWPDMAAETTRYAVEIPYLGSLILTHDWNGQIPGLKEFAPEDRPNSTIVFWTFRIMVGLGMLMLLLGVWSLWLRWRQRLFRSKLFLRFAVVMGPAGLIAILAGWYTTEIGRQPWVVYGVMRTKDAVSNHSALTLSTTLIVFIVMYFAVFGTGISYMLKLVAKGPQAHSPEDVAAERDAQNRRPARPLSAAPD